MAVPNLTANSPVNGSIAWSAFTIQYAGVAYGVGASSTALRYTYWLYNGGSPSLQASNTLPTLGADDILLFVNKAGIPINVPASSVVDGSLIVDGTIVGTALIAGTVHGDRITANTIGAGQIAANAITTDELAANAVTAENILAHVITAEHIAVDAITANEIAADAITAEHLSADAVTANAIAAGAIDGTVITGALFRTAAAGARVEVNTGGLLQFDAVNTLISRIGPEGNVFSGVVDATSIRVRDGLELFGQNNMFGSNAKVTLQTGQAGSSSAPSMYTKYETQELPAEFTPGYWYLRGFWQDSDGSDQAGVANEYGGDGLLLGPGGKRFFLANETNGFRVTRANGENTRRYNHPAEYARFNSGGSKGVFIAGLVYDGFPDGAWANPTFVVVDDAPMNTSGTARPTIVAETKVVDFNWFHTHALGRVFGPPGGPSAGRETLFAHGLAYYVNGVDTLELKLKGLSGANVVTNYTGPTVNFSSYRISSDERIRAVHYGSTWAMGMTGSAGSGDVWLLQTTHQNIVLSADATVRHTNYEWPVIPGSTRIAFAAGDVVSNTCTKFGTVNEGANVDAASEQRISWYSNWTWVGTSSLDKRIWAQFAWRGHSSKAPEWLTPPSAMSQPFIPAKRSLVGLSVPSLPTPEGGTGAARDVDKDVYGWVLYLGQGTSQPSNGAMYRQGISPGGDPTTVTTLDMSAFPTLSGSVPVTATTGFPNLSPAKIVSSAASGGVPLLSLDGDGNITAKNVSVSEVLTAKKEIVSNYLGQDPTTPGASTAKLYFKTGGHLYTKDPGGKVRGLTSDLASYTPTTTGINAPSISAVYILDGNDIVHLRIAVTLAAGGTITGHVALGLPFVMGYDFGFSVIFKDATGANYQGGYTVTGGGGTINLYTTGTNGQQGVLSSGVPFVWAAGDIIEVNGAYKK